jgi:hypothetical protein
MALKEIERTYGDEVRVGRKSLFKFGRNQLAGSSEAIICHDGISPVGFGVTFPTTNTLTSICSTNAGDTQTLTVEGCTVSGGVLTFVSQTVTLTGQTDATLGTALAVCSRVQNLGSATATSGDVYVHEGGATTGGVPDNLGTVGNVMAVEDQTTLFAGTFITSTNYFIMTHLYVNVAKKTSAYCDFRLETRTSSTPWVTQEVESASRDSGGVAVDFFPYRIVPPNSLVAITSNASTTSVDVMASFYGFFADIVS